MARICYIARHGCGGNQDEEAIAFALRKLGHEVDCVQERFAVDITARCDFALFHHWSNFAAMKTLRSLGYPLVFWNFDLVSWPDPTLEARNRARVEWMREVMEIVDIGFCTDADYAAKHPSTLVWLPQGADERVMGSDHTNDKVRNILLTCMVQGCGTQRESFYNEMTNMKNYTGVLYAAKGMYREELRKEIGRSRMVVCPDSPVTHRYWSNRVWNACGFGAFTLHPYCRELAKMYTDGKEIVFYDSIEHLHKLIKFWLEDDLQRAAIGRAALERTRAHHTYRHRCEVLVSTVRERLGL